MRSSFSDQHSWLLVITRLKLTRFPIFPREGGKQEDMSLMCQDQKLDHSTHSIKSAKPELWVRTILKELIEWKTAIWGWKPL